MMVFVWTLDSVLFCAFLSIATIIGILISLKRLFCKHRVTYTNGCTHDVICKRCGKNLGFVGNYKEGTK